MIVFEILFGLLTSLPLWLVAGLVWAVLYYRNPCNKNAPLKKDVTLWILIAVLGMLNLLFIPVHVTSLINAGPTSGIVVDAKTGRLIPGATVIMTWIAPGKAPIALPWWVYLLPNPPSCDVAYKTTADTKGHYSIPWQGFKTWRGCTIASLNVSAKGYEPFRLPDYNDGQPNDRAAAPFSSLAVRMVPAIVEVPKGNW